jgi:predicted transcriptional regulator
MSKSATEELLEILSVLDPEPMDFSNILGTDNIDEEIKSGNISVLLKEGLIETTNRKYHYKISAKGKQWIESGGSSGDSGLDEEIDKIMRPSLQPYNWEHKNIMIHEGIFKNSTQMGGDIPILCFGMDKPEMFEPIQKTPNNEKYYDLFKASAMRNIIKEKVSVNDVKMGEFTMTVVTGGYYAAEKVFDKEFMKKIQKDHNYPMLAVGLPRKATMYITNGILPPETLGKFIQVIGFKYAENEPTKPLSKTAFIVQEGELSGVITPTYEDGNINGKKTESGEKKSFWGKLFGKS